MAALYIPLLIDKLISQQCYRYRRMAKAALALQYDVLPLLCQTTGTDNTIQIIEVVDHIYQLIWKKNVWV